MADLSDADVESTLDYLGRQQPLAGPRTGLSTDAGGASVGGGASVTAGGMPSVTQRAQAARAIGASGPSEAQQIVGGLSTAKSFAEKVAKIRDLFPSETRRGEVAGDQTPLQFIDGRAVATDPGAFTPVPPADIGQFTAVPGGELPAFTPVPDIGAAGFEAVEAANSGASAGAAAGEAALGSAAEVIPFLGGAFALAQDIMSNKGDVEKGIDAALDVASTFFGPIGAAALPIAKSDVHTNLKDIQDKNWIKFALYDTNPIALPVKIVDDILQMFGVDIFGGGDKPSHAQREQTEIQKKIDPQATAFQKEMQQAKSPADLWASLVAHQSGTVGGTSPMAVAVSLPESADHLRQAVAAGDVALPTRYDGDVDAFLRDHKGTVRVGPGNPNDFYPVFTEQGFYSALRADPKGLQAGVQAGVSQDKLSPMNTMLAHTILRQYASLYQPPAPEAPPAMPAQGVSSEGPGGGALGFSREVMNDSTAGP